MLTLAEQARYDRDGYVVVGGAISAAACERMCDRIWDALAAEHGVRRDDPTTWAGVTPSGFQKLCKADAFAEIASRDFLAAVDDLIGEGTWEPPRHWGGPLVTFPTDGPWDVPARRWHLDYPVRGSHGPRFAVKALCILTRLATGGGGTLLLAGSHHLTTRVAATAPAGAGGHSGDVRRMLARQQTWFGDLVSNRDASDRVRRFMRGSTEIDGVSLRVVEFAGEAGDSVFFHPWLFHNASPNCRATPRMVVGQNFTTRAGLSIYARPGARTRRLAPSSL